MVNYSLKKGDAYMADYYNPGEQKFKCEKKEKKFECCNVHITVNCSKDKPGGPGCKYEEEKHCDGCQVYITVNCDEKEEKKDKCHPYNDLDV